MYGAFTVKMKVTTDTRITIFNVNILYIALIFKQRR